MHTYHSSNGFTRWYCLSLILLLTACSTNPPGTSPSIAQKPTASKVASIPSPPPVPEICQPTPFSTAKGSQLPEAQGRATNAELWTLFFADPKSIHLNQEVKIVWRMTGTGSLQVVARHAGDIQIRPVWGPEEHGGSNWQRPGAEWGTGFQFSSVGCWNLHAKRGEAAGDIWIMVQK